MIEAVYINGTQLTNNNTYLNKLTDIGGADVAFSNYARGGVAGQIISNPLKKGIMLTMGFTVIGSSFANFVQQRDRLVKYLQNIEDTDEYFKTLLFKLGDGTYKQIDVVFSKITSSITPKNIINQEFTVSAVSEKEYYESRDEKTALLTLADLGGMSIPMDIPMTFNNNAIATVETLTNNGNTTGRPTIRVYGEFTSGFNIINITNNKTLSYGEALDAGDYLDIDLYNRTAVENGITNKLGSISGDWLYLTSGDNILQITGSGGDSGTALITYKDYYANL